MSPMDTSFDTMTSSSASERGTEREIALCAQNDYESGNYSGALKQLDSLNEISKALHFNRLITQFSIDKKVEPLLDELFATEDLDLDQQVLADYNRALVLAKHLDRTDDAIDLLDKRMSVLYESVGLVEDRLTIKVSLLLAILYMERRKDPSKALPLLQFITEKCDASNQPARLQILKAKCYLQMNSTKSAKRELKSISGEAYVRSHLELQRSNFKKAMKIFSGCFEDSPLYYNNEALVHYGLGKRNTAVYHIIKATSSNSSPEILYNLAIMHLFTGNASNAHDLLHHLVPHFKNNPRIWFRLAECRLEERCKVSLGDLGISRCKEELIQSYLGNGLSKKLILGNAASKQRTMDKESLLFARGCLSNSLTVLNSPSCSFYPSNPPSEVEAAKFKISILIALSYVNLCLSEFSIAYNSARTALSLSPKDYQKVLSNLYAGEALLWLDRYSEAIEHFLPEHATVEVPLGEEAPPTLPPSISSWYPQTAKIVLLCNQAANHSLRGDFDRSDDVLRQVSSNLSAHEDAPIQALMLAVFNQLQQGSVDGAKMLIRNRLAK